ncbi:27540_t:CDS:1, partial [Gigaspora margarita]
HPLVRKTDLKSEELKAFKIKILMQELLILLTLHMRNPIKNKEIACKLYLKEVDNQQYWLTCSKNELSLEEVIKITLNEVKAIMECQIVLVKTYNKKVHEIYIKKKLLLTVITDE